MSQEFAGRRGTRRLEGWQRWMPVALAGAILGLGAPAARAQLYTVDIRPQLNGLDIAIEPVSSSGMLVVNLTNNSPTRVRCNLNFDASPQTPVRATRHIDPGKRESSVLRAKRRWFTVTVDVVCTPAPR